MSQRRVQVLPIKTRLPGVIVAGLLYFQGCGVVLDGLGLKEEVSATESQAVELPQEESPVALTVAQAFFEQGKLNVKVHVEAKRELESEQVVVLLQGLKEGEVVAEQVQKLSEAVASKELDVGERVVLMFGLEDQDLTEYQVRCSWGDEAIALAQEVDGRLTNLKTESPLASKIEGNPEQAKAKDAPAVKESAAVELSQEANVVLEQVKVSENKTHCSKEPCDIFYTVSARVANVGNAPARGIRLGVGLYWANSGQQPLVPEQGTAASPGEEVVEFGDLSILPGTGRRIKVTVDRNVPVLSGGAFVPHLRILSFSKAE